MDWNQDGHTSLGEFLASGDVGRRPISVDGRNCSEFFDDKDGLPLKRVCYDVLIPALDPDGVMPALDARDAGIQGPRASSMPSGSPGHARDDGTN